jgi:hypothetical protein
MLYSGATRRAQQRSMNLSILHQAAAHVDDWARMALPNGNNASSRNSYQNSVNLDL